MPAAVFRTLGAKLHNLPPIEATEAIADAVFTMVDNAGYTVPEGTQVSIATNEGDQLGFETVSDGVVAPGSTTVTIGLRAIEAGAQGSGLTANPELVDALAYISSVTLVSETTGGIDAESDADYLDRLSQEFETLAPRPIIPRDFAILAQSIAGVDRAVAIDGYNPDHNLLSVNQASLETDTTGWAAHTNATIARSTAQAADGAASLAVTSVASGTMKARTSSGTSGVPVTPHDEYTAIADFRAAVSPRSVQMQIEWYGSGGGVVGTAATGVLATDTTTGFTRAVVTGRAPATAAYAAALVVITSTGGASEVHYVDRIAFRRGTSTAWTVGGTPASDNERMIAVAVADAVGQPVSSQAKADVDTLLQAMREVNFVVNVLDPTYTTIDVTFTADSFENFAAADVEAQAEAAVASYLDPANFGQPNSGEQRLWVNETQVRLFELVGVLENVEGLNHVTSLTFAVQGDSLGTTDIPLAGLAPLPQAGTISGTVS